MINNEAVKYVITQIRFLDFYKNHVIYFNKQIKKIEENIAFISSPKSPQGGYKLGNYPNDINIKIVGHGKTNEEVIASLVTESKKYEQELKHYYGLYFKANRYYEKLLEHEEHDFVADFFNGIPYKEIEQKYSISNIYDHMNRIVKQQIKRI